jgi:hypothetical protein
MEQEDVCPPPPSFSGAHLPDPTDSSGKQDAGSSCLHLVPCGRGAWRAQAQAPPLTRTLVSVNLPPRLLGAWLPLTSTLEVRGKDRRICTGTCVCVCRVDRVSCVHASS